MTDYLKDIGGNTTLMIRDLNPRVEFWVRTGSDTWNYQQDWSFEGPGFNSGRRQFRMEKGGAWQFMGAHDFPGGRINVRLTIFDEDLGFPTSDFWQTLTRVVLPGAPPPSVWERTPNSIHVTLDGGSNGGAPILESEIWWSWDQTPRFRISNTRDTWVAGLNARSRYFFWGKQRNELGWSDFGPRAEGRTLGVPDPPLPVFFREVGQDRVTADFYIPDGWYDGGAPIEEWAFGYGLNPGGPSFDVPGPNKQIKDLEPGQTYYFWAAGRNAFGWSNWSQRSEVQLIAGLLITIDNQPHRAVPYEKVDGVWRIVRPWSKSAGIWKESAL